MSNNDYNSYCESDNCTNQLPINAFVTRKYCNLCQVERKKLQLAVIVKKRRERLKSEKLLELKIVA